MAMVNVPVTDTGTGTKKSQYDEDLAGKLYQTTGKMLLMPNEFNRTGYGYKAKYGTYANYLDAMRDAAGINRGSEAVVNDGTGQQTVAKGTGTESDLSNYQKLLEEQKNAQISSINSAYDINKQTAESNYDKALSAVSEEYRAVLEALGLTKRTQERGAYVNLQKLLKYLPEYLQRQGLSGLGISASSVIDAYGRYQDALNAIEAENQKTVSEYDRQRLSDTATIEQNKANALASYNLQQLSASQEVTDNYYAALAKLMADEEQKKQQQATAAAELLSNYLGGGSSEDSFDFDDWSGDSGSGTSGSGKQSDVQVVGKNAKTSSGTFLGIGSGWKDREGDNIHINLNGNVFKAEIGSAPSNSVVQEIKDAVGTLSPNTILQYNGKTVVVTDTGNLRYLRSGTKQESKLQKYLAS